MGNVIFKRMALLFRPSAGNKSNGLTVALLLTLSSLTSHVSPSSASALAHSYNHPYSAKPLVKQWVFFGRLSHDFFFFFTISSLLLTFTPSFLFNNYINTFSYSITSYLVQFRNCWVNLHDFYY